MSASHATILHPSRIGLTLSCLLFAELLLGLAHAASLPPFEGFDETGHFSSIQQVADTGMVPRLPEARISAAVDDYAARAPMPYASAPPFDDNGSVTYEKFFSTASRNEIERARHAAHDAIAPPAPFRPGLAGNHIAQHPPLFYAAMVPVLALTRESSLAVQLFALRAASYVLAWTALAIGVIVAMRYLPAMPHREVAIVAAAAWPLAVPSWFPAMARLGNDSLVALLVALLWWQMAARGSRTGIDAVIIGALLGLGAIAKALMLPIAAGTLAWIASRGWRDRTPAMATSLTRAAIAAVVALAISSWWYLGPSAVAVAGEEAVRLHELGGMLPALRLNFSVAGYAAGVAAFLGMLVWSGTWSLARPPYIAFVPLMAAMAIAAIAYPAIVGRQPSARLWRLPLWWIAPVLAGFAYHILVHVALTGNGRGVGGYYLHVLVAPLAGMLGLVVARAWQRGRAIVLSVYAYAVTFAIAVGWAQLLLFAGIFTKAPNKYFAAATDLPPWLGIPDAIARLQVLAFPGLAAVLAVLGATMLAAAAWSLRGVLVRSEAMA